MIAYSWNMFYENKNLDAAHSFVANSSFDIFCLQEVPEKFLSALKTLPYEIVYTAEIELSSASKFFPVYSVTLSKHPIIFTDEIPLTDSVPSLCVKAIRYIIDLPRKEPIKKWENRKSFFVDIQTDYEIFRVFNLHLPLTHPQQRKEELIRALSFHDPQKRLIICGDFNILERFYITPLNWMLGGKVSDWILSTRERNDMEALFKESNVCNPLRGKTTHKISQSQLDHIIIPDSFSVKEVTVIDNCFGSDHNPIRVDFC